MSSLEWISSPEPINEEKDQQTVSPPNCDDFVGVVIPRQTLNTSAFEGFEPPLPKSTERDAIDTLLRDFSSYEIYDGSEFLSVQLDDFSIYKDRATNERNYGLIALNDVAKVAGSPVFFFDGIVRPEVVDDPVFYLERISFMTVSIGGYEDLERHGVGNDVWIQSTYCNTRGQIWYRLGKPAREYAPYHHTFLWVANLAKHFVDYLKENRNVALSAFKSHFREWLWEHHHLDSTFRGWLEEFGGSDFRQAIVAHAPFLRGQALGLDSEYEEHFLWDEIGLSSTPAVPKQPSRAKYTVVTPYIYKCFKDMPWGQYLQIVNLDSTMAARHQQLVHRMGFVPRKRRVVTGSKAPIEPGDVVAINRDNQTSWKGDDDLWYALVQRVSGAGHYLSLIWLYKATDTLCADLTYPHCNELFLSDHCNCGDSKIKVTEVVKKVSVTFFSDRAIDTDFFVRQTYHSGDETFRTLHKGDFECQCSKSQDRKYNVGDTVLVETSDVLEPVEIVEVSGDEVKVRVLLRRSRDFNDDSCRPNELVYTGHFRHIHLEEIRRRCHIRFFSEEQRDKGGIPAPYNRDGNGSAFYITCEESAQGLRPMTRPASFCDGFDPLEAKRKLRALNLFCGGGTFDRGLEEGTAIRSEWAVEWDLPPMLTYRANHTNPEDVKLFRGSVDDFLAVAIRGQGSDLVAKLGQVEFISAGSPCQGYSLANSRKGNKVSLRNSSMIASVAAYVDFYRPQYAILENVPAMASKTHERNPLSQLICAFVGLGYQLRLMHLDAWSYGAPQSRSRLFLLIAAPGLQLPEHPALTHSHPMGTTIRSLGEAPNGLPFGERRWEVPIFKFVSAYEGTKDLPDLDRAKVASIPWPDHRTSRNESNMTQVIIDQVPKHPRKSGFSEAMTKGFLNFDPFPGDIKRRNPPSRAWSRVDPNFLIPTITTAISPHCKFTGRWLHWREDRLLTIMEARRAQGYPDSEVLVGRAAHQWKIVGNSVARQVALALGLSIREATLCNPPLPPYGETEEIIETCLNKKKRKRRVSEIVVNTSTATVVTTTTTTRYRLEQDLSIEDTSTGISTLSLGERTGTPFNDISNPLQVSLSPLSKPWNPILKKVKSVQDEGSSSEDPILID
ncbi:DNA (cytosine-5)-methyltransferase, putative [Coccidioides posadasii C735 delta SOWgp]|uniref:Cytosine-specific methyltransferase n=1 Tax=Coccidioides posadasii (strain C735) TaxID=222929 RepID=C5PFQ4_COCP7|nr:DNA (cytosine-5)-methyltransferase, putative [Coccidioides posadasii C735 delta SOWgp]EER23357.1 DNA (cytosine-5)-methyltransferase, putative [Coccidioides posadasii C735 delta SOWgp]|eukprot:XP_003065502.1 DNA (cytosine-5)-methyltransferase, putative [Coccidioides posadasii C735 delta SOWgp]